VRREFDRDGDLAAAGSVKDGVDAVGRDGSDSVADPVAVENGCDPEAMQILVVGGAGGADHADAAGQGQLSGESADSAGRGVDE
jgi:hypothetical protein